MQSSGHFRQLSELSQNTHAIGKNVADASDAFRTFAVAIDRSTERSQAYADAVREVEHVLEEFVKVTKLRLEREGSTPKTIN